MRLLIPSPRTKGMITHTLLDVASASADIGHAMIWLGSSRHKKGEVHEAFRTMLDSWEDCLDLAYFTIKANPDEPQPSIEIKAVFRRDCRGMAYDSAVTVCAAEVSKLSYPLLQVLQRQDAGGTPAIKWESGAREWEAGEVRTTASEYTMVVEFTMDSEDDPELRVPVRILVSYVMAGIAPAGTDSSKTPTNVFRARITKG